MQDLQQDSGNPLKKHFRQPKIYITLPSKGKSYPEGSFVPTENEEIPIYAMTAKDEIMMKTPDALISGQSTVEVIQSCVPNIKNAWSIPTLDMDAILIAIRIATYGDTMDIDITTPVTKEDKTYSVNMRTMLDNVTSAEFQDTLYLDDMTIKIRPLSYKEFTQNSLKSFEEQRIFNILNDDSVTEGQKIDVFNKAFRNLTELTIASVENSIVSIDIDGQSVTNHDHIKEFIQNAEKDVYRKIVNHVEAERLKFAIKPLTVDATPEEIEQGVPETYTVPITFDHSNFFG